MALCTRRTTNGENPLFGRLYFCNPYRSAGKDVKELYFKYQLTDTAVDRIVEMAWEDRTPFEAIRFQFGLSEAEVVQLMKSEMTLRNWKKWRARVHGRKTKHSALRDGAVSRFRADRQKAISRNRITKR